MSKKRWKSFLVKEFLEREHCDDPERAIIRKAQRLVKNADYMKPPIDIFRLANLQGIKIREIKKINCDGQLIPSKDYFIIEIRENNTFKRKRFTIAHEICHALLLGQKFLSLLPKDRVEILNALNPDKEVEQLCNLGAGELLMPSYLFLPRLKRYKVSINGLFELSKDFQTSITSTAMRIVRADGRCVFILWKLMSKPGGEKELRVDWSVAPKDIFIPRYDRPKSRNLSLNTVCEAFEQGRSSRFEKVEWLGNLKGCYYVESVRLNSYIPSVLSLLHLN
jgi:Zn-dependent peptidase ImmA (M78 family)